MTTPLRLLIVDDETHARQGLRRLADQCGLLLEIDEATDGIDAVERIAAFQPHVLLLDIEMPGANGFDVLRAFPERDFQVVFQTAFSEHAIRAFEENACDYLLKPISLERLRTALTRAATRLGASNWLATERSLLERKRYMTHLFLRNGTRAAVVHCQDVVAIVVEEGEARLITSNEVRQAPFSLTWLEERLDPSLFRRVHRNAIVSLRHIRRVLCTFPMRIVMTTGDEIVVSKERRHAVRLWLEDSGMQLRDE